MVLGGLFFAFNQLMASPSFSFSTLSCDLQYMVDDAVRPYDATGKQGVNMLGTESNAKIVSTLGGGHTVNFESFLQNGKDYFSVTILEDNGAEIYKAKMLWKGFSLKLPVEFTENDTFIDPKEAKQLILTCDETSTAG